jgi:hypothetical protein
LVARFVASERALRYRGDMPLERVGPGWSAAIAAWLLFAAAALAPFPFGSVTPPAIAFWCIVLGGCLVFAPVRPLGAGQLSLIFLAGICRGRGGVGFDIACIANHW